MKIDTFNCDVCGNPAKITMTLYDNEYKKEVSVTDLCETHFNLIRSFIRHGCPPVSKLPIEPTVYDKNELVDIQPSQR